MERGVSKAPALGAAALHLAALAAAVVVAFGAAPAAAVELYRNEAHDLRVALDTTVSVGASVRTQGRDCRTIWVGHDGCSVNPQTINLDDGNLNYDTWDFYSANTRATVELEVDWKNFGAFVRAVGFYDFLQNDTNSTDRTDLADPARHRASRVEGGVVGTQFQLLDAYVDGSFELFDRPLDIRVGNQLVSWGENVFIPGGINQINPVDVSKLRVPGSEIKEALLPSPMVRLQTEIVRNLGLDAYYQFWWNPTYLDPTGTFFSGNDLVGRAAEGLFFPNQVGPPLPPAPLGPADPGGTGLPADALTGLLRGAPIIENDDPDDQGQFGVALRYFAEPIQTEFGAYYVHYHSKTPVVGFQATGFVLPPVLGGSQNAPVAYFRQYPDHINLVGLSFATQIVSAAVAGEISYRPDDPVPLQAVGRSVLPAFPVVTELDGYTEEHRLQFQLNAIGTLARGTRFVGALVDWIGADDIIVIAEGALVYYPDLAEPCTAKLRSPGLPPPLDTPSGCTPYAPPGASDNSVDDVSWGYQLRVQPTWTNPFAIPVRVQPFVSWQHDVKGTTPGFSPFIDQRLGVSLGLDVIYLDAWTGRVSWGNFFNAGERDLGHDRDFLSFSLSYSF